MKLFLLEFSHFVSAKQSKVLITAWHLHSIASMWLHGDVKHKILFKFHSMSWFYFEKPQEMFIPIPVQGWKAFEWNQLQSLWNMQLWNLVISRRHTEGQWGQRFEFHTLVQRHGCFLFQTVLLTLFHSERVRHFLGEIVLLSRGNKQRTSSEMM